MKRLVQLTVIAALLVAVAACSSGGAATPPANPKVDAAKATEIATNAFEGYNAADYSAWTRDWSNAMKSAVKASDFATIRADIFGRMGRFVALGVPVLGSRQTGYYNWKFPVTFEKGTASVMFGFAQDGSLVEGVKFE